MVEFERTLIQERIKAGLRNVKAKGKRIGRPKQQIDSSKILELRALGLSVAFNFSETETRTWHGISSGQAIVVTS